MPTVSSMRHLLSPLGALVALAVPGLAMASEADIPLPSLDGTTFALFGATISAQQLLMGGLLVCVLGAAFGLMQWRAIDALPAHKSMLEISELIWQTCKVYMLEQGRFLVMLELLIGAIIAYYFAVLAHMSIDKVIVVLLWSVIGILGSYGVAFFGMRVNTLANSRTAFASLQGKPFPVYAIPLQAGMSIGMLLISVELVLMLFILLFVAPENAGACFVGFAIGESLGASVLRICGGIFTKIADIGSDLMKIVFNIKEDDARNPGVIGDCGGDNAGDSVGPTAHGFETYGVTGVALITFIALAVNPELQAKLLVWIFIMRVMMIVTSLVAFYINDMMAKGRFLNADKMDFEQPLTMLVWLTSIISIAMTYAVSYLLIADLGDGSLWWLLATIITCGTLAGAIIPELTKAFTSANSAHVAEIVDASREGGASLTVLSGLVAGNFSAFWMGLTIVGLMGAAYWTSLLGLDAYMQYPAVFAFGLVAFGVLGMGPVTIAVDSYGPVTDNAQSVYELSLIENVPNVKAEVQKDFGFTPDFDRAKEHLEENDGAGNTFQAPAKPVLIGTAVVGATTMVFATIMALEKAFPTEFLQKLSVLNANFLLGLMAGGSVIYWFTGASTQAVATGAYRAVEFIKKNIKLENTDKASIEDSKKVVAICTQYAQKGMFNIFLAIFFSTLAFAFYDPFFFIGYLIAIALFGLFQALFMANAGGAWDNAKKVVETELRAKGTPLHAASIVGDTVGDPFKDTSSVAMNPVIKFTTLFGLLAVELALGLRSHGLLLSVLSICCFLISTIFVYRSFYGMRIKSAN